MPKVAVAQSIVAQIGLSDQRLRLSVDGRVVSDWPVSTGRPGYRTPIGTFRPVRLARTWYSTKYDNAPMPYSVFFHGGCAMHSTKELSRLGRPVSHGCIRLHPVNARILFELVRERGLADARIVINPDPSIGTEAGQQLRGTTKEISGGAAGGRHDGSDGGVEIRPNDPAEFVRPVPALMARQGAACRASYGTPQAAPVPSIWPPLSSSRASLARSDAIALRAGRHHQTGRIERGSHCQCPVIPEASCRSAWNQ